jgi:hypothetical protein
MVKHIAFARCDARKGVEATKIGNVWRAPKAVRLSNSVPQIG